MHPVRQSIHHPQTRRAEDKSSLRTGPDQLGSVQNQWVIADLLVFAKADLNVVSHKVSNH